MTVSRRVSMLYLCTVNHSKPHWPFILGERIMCTYALLKSKMFNVHSMMPHFFKDGWTLPPLIWHCKEGGGVVEGFNSKKMSHCWISIECDKFKMCIGRFSYFRSISFPLSLSLSIQWSLPHHGHLDLFMALKGAMEWERGRCTSGSISSMFSSYFQFVSRARAGSVI
jgi:hypothetical protein